MSDSPVLRLVSMAEAAEMLGVHKNTIRGLIARGDLPAVRLGPQIIRIDVAELEKLGTPIGGAR